MKWIATPVAAVCLLGFQASAQANSQHLSMLEKCQDMASCMNITEQLLSKAPPSAASKLQYAANTPKKRRSISHRQMFYHLPANVNHNLGERMFVFSPRLRQWAAYNRYGKRVAYGAASGGANWCKDVGRACRTPGGAYRVHSKGKSSCRSSKYPLGKGGAKMPYCMFFHKGYAIHGSPYISGRNGSHGCIRVRTPAAQWLHRYFINHGTKVVVLPYS